MVKGWCGLIRTEDKRMYYKCEGGFWNSSSLEFASRARANIRQGGFRFNPNFLGLRFGSYGGGSGLRLVDVTCSGICIF